MNTHKRRSGQDVTTSTCRRQTESIHLREANFPALLRVAAIHTVVGKSGSDRSSISAGKGNEADFEPTVFCMHTAHPHCLWRLGASPPSSAIENPEDSPNIASIDCCNARHIVPLGVTPRGHVNVCEPRENRPGDWFFPPKVLNSNVFHMQILILGPCS